MTTDPRSAFERLFYEQILPSEGGYTPHSKGDPETLFGITDNEWRRLARSISDETINSYAPDIRDHLLAIRNATDEKSAREAAHSFIQYVKPFLNSYQVVDNAPEWQRAQVTDAQDAAFRIFYHDFVTEPGYDHYPAFIAPYMVDYGMNAGPDTANGALRNVMHRMHVSRPSDMEQFSPEQKRQAIRYFNEERSEHYNQIARNGKQRFREGWLNRVQEFYHYVGDHFDTSLPKESIGAVPATPCPCGEIQAAYRPPLMEQDGRIYIEIPGHGIAIYNVDEKGRFTGMVQTPPGVSLDLESEADRNPFEHGHTLSWRERNERRYINITPALNDQIRGNTPQPLFNRAGVGVVEPVTNGHIDPAQSTTIEMQHIEGSAGIDMPERPLPGSTPWPTNDSVHVRGARPEDTPQETARLIANSTTVPQEAIEQYLRQGGAPLPMVNGATDFLKVQCRSIITMDPNQSRLEIGVEIPYRGVVTYMIDAAGNFISSGDFPPGVTLDGPNDTDRNPYRGTYTISWLDENGNRQYIPLNQRLNQRIEQATRQEGLIGHVFPHPLGFTYTNSERCHFTDRDSGYMSFNTRAPFSGEAYYVENPAGTHIPDAPPGTPIYRERDIPGHPRSHPQ